MVLRMACVKPATTRPGLLRLTGSRCRPDAGGPGDSAAQGEVHVVDRLPYYRPDLRVKSRDGGTALGPWLVDRDDVADPMNLQLRTEVNGRVVQEGHTGDMIHDLASLIEDLSSYMTLSPGDVILTGTPKGSVDVQPGDEVVCEVEGVGRLVNTLVADWA
jgi:2-keto-4-pentenoate hydratase/2-oxohepta-3-ene-1,7-dioic acid hydratase in catechol pathway